MKTNQILKRPMGQFTVLQRTSDSMFNATSLLDQWNNENPNDKRRLDHFWNSTHLPELMGEIAKNELDFNSPNFGDLKNALSKTKRGRENGGTWMHPYLFVKFAMYLSPKFEYSVIRFVYDELVKNRHLAGDKYGILMNSIARFRDVDYSQVGKALNWIVFNTHSREFRNNGNSKQLNELYELENKLAFAVDMGFIKSYQELITTMRKMYNDKYQKF